MVATDVSDMELSPFGLVISTALSSTVVQCYRTDDGEKTVYTAAYIKNSRRVLDLRPGPCAA